MRATISFANLSADRPSLLMRFLAAIGPGTVLCKTSSLDIRHDGTSLSLLRARLPHYAFLPVPNSHYVPAEVETILGAHDVVVGGRRSAADADARVIDFLRRQSLDPGSVLREWKDQLDLGPYGTAEYASGLRAIYQLPQTGPVIIVGAPEDYLGYPPLDHPRDRDCHHTELYELLVASGYAERFRFVNARKRPGHAGLEEFGAENGFLRVDDGAERPFVDVGLVHLGHTRAGRTVMVVAGSSHPFGTLAGVRICCDHGRNRLQQLVAKYAAGERQQLAVRFRVRPQVDAASIVPLSATAPIDAEISITDDAGLPSELLLREAEQRFAALQPAQTTPQRRAGLLADHLRARGEVSVIVKSYPVDRRDDSTAKDLLEAVLPGVRDVPVPENVPHHRTPSDNDDVLATAIDEVLARRNVPGSIIATLAGLDAEWWERIEHWKRVLAARRAGGGALRDLVDGGERLPASGPLLILGEPRSFVGADAPPGAAASDRPQLASLLADIGHPNRFELRGFAGADSVLFDHKRIRRLTVASSDTVDRDTDMGLIHLTRGREDRDVLVIAGNHWLGTLAGVQLAFAERRPSIDRAVQDYVEGRRRSVDIGYRCRRIEARRAPGGVRFPMCHPSVDLEVELVDEAGLDESFVRGRDADDAFGPLWCALDGRNTTALGDDSIAMEVVHDDGPRVRLTCRSCLQLKKSTERGEQLIFRSAPTAKLHANFVDRVRQARRTFERDKAANRYRCYCFLVVGPPGSGKENMGHLLHDTLGHSALFAQANVAGLPETLILSSLFGHARGSFTGADKDRQGLFETVGDGGVCVLDEFAAGSAVLQEQFQPALLRFLQFGTGQRVGAGTAFHNRTFLLASTNESETLAGIESLVRTGRVRADLIDRFGHRCELPALSARPLEILPTFLWMLAQCGQAPPPTTPGDPLVTAIERRALERLLHHPWPGNFRQLEQVAERIAFDIDQTGDPVVRDAALASALGIDTDDKVDPPDPPQATVVHVELAWGFPGRPTIRRRARGPLPEPRPQIEWPVESSITIRGLDPISGPTELCRRLAHMGAEPKAGHRIGQAADTMRGANPGGHGAAALALLGDKAIPAEKTGPLVRDLLAGLVCVGRNKVGSNSFSVPYLAKWILMTLAARGETGEAHVVDPAKVAGFRFPLEADAWEGIWRAASDAAATAIPRSFGGDDRRLFCTLVVLLLTGVDLRDDESLRRIRAANDLALQRTMPRG